MKESDVYYNYFGDVNPQYRNIDFELKDRVDPDRASSKVYYALWNQFYKKDDKYHYQVKSQECNNVIFYSIFGIEAYNTDNEKTAFILSSDYIGPSISQAKEIAVLEEFEIKSMLSSWRTLGGHMIWVRGINAYRKEDEERWVTLYYEFKDKTKNPHYYYNLLLNSTGVEEYQKKKAKEDQLTGGKWKQQSLTINNQKGGKWKLYDRIDWTLLLLKLYYDFINDSAIEEKDKICKNGLEKYSNQCMDYLSKQPCFGDENLRQLKNRIKNMYYAFDNSREWLREFSDFNKFCEFFKLKGNFVLEDCEINMLTAIFPVKPKKYEEYIKNNISAISRRNQKMSMLI